MRNNQGSVSVEASVVLPIFLFTMLFFIYVCELYRVKATVYEAGIETAEYMAEYAFLSDEFLENDSIVADIAGAGMVMLRFNEYVDNDALLEKYVVGGKKGVSFIGSSLPDDHGFIDLHISYFVHVDIPILGNHHHLITEHIRQRAYLGYRGNQEASETSEDDRYVYVARNGVVYHNTRNCTYLKPDIHGTSLESAKISGYKACEYCGGAAGNSVYITTDGNRYHSRRNCSRLKRTVERKKLSEVNLPPFSKCGE